MFLAVEKAVSDAKADPSRPVCLVVKTIKGYGVKSTEASASGGHGFPLSNGEKIVGFVDEIYGGQPPAEFAAWAAALRSDWEQKEAAKSQSGIGPRRPRPP